MIGLLGYLFLIIHVVSSNDIDIPINEKNVYDYIELENGLKCIVISCAECPEAAASLSVGVGSNQDPLPGLAHFVEHMLFYSSKSYPTEDYLRTFVNSHSGDTNAYTDKEETNYYLTISNDALEECLKIFSKAFIEPIFVENAVNREIKAVNSEHDKNRYDDIWRMARLTEILAGKKHPISHFATGTNETLKGDGIVREVQKFFDNYYLAENMNLVIYGKYSVKKLLQLAVDYFSDIPSGKNEFIYEKPYEEGGKIVVAPLMSEGSVMDMFWAFPSEFKNYQYQPCHFISYLLNYNGKNSISSTLSDYITFLESYTSMTYSDFSIIEVKITLTEKGFDQWKYVAECVLAYVEQLKQLSADELKKLWSDYSQIAQLNFDYSEFSSLSDEIVVISSNMQNFPKKHYISGFFIKEEFDYKLIAETLNMITSDTLFMVFMSSHFEKGTIFDGSELEFSYNEPYYDFDYDILEVELSKNDNTFSIIEINESIPSDLSILSCKDCSDSVIQLENSDISLQMWYKFEDSFKQPKVIISFVLFSSSDTVLRDIHCELAGRIISEELVMFLESGFFANIKSEYSGISVTLTGWRDKMQDFLEEVIKILSKPNLSKINTVAEYLNEIYLSASNEQAYMLAYEKLANIILEDYYTYPEKLEILANFELKDFINYLEDIQYANIDLFIYGNVLQVHAQNYKEIISDYFEPSEKHVRKYPQAVSVSGGAVSIDTSISNHCIFNWYDFGYYDPTTFAILKVLNAKSSDEAFKILRTNYQLGYAVISDVIDKFGINILYIAVQGTYKNPPDMDEIIEIFWDDFEFLPEDMSLVETVAENLLWKYESMETEHDFLWTEILNGRREFDHNKILAENVRKVTYEDISKVLDTIRSEGADLSVQIYLQGSEPDNINVGLNYNKSK